MAVPTLALPQFAVEDGRGFFFASELNNNLFIWPNVNNGATASTVSTYATASHTVTGGPDATGVPSGGAGTYNIIMVDLNGTKFFLQPQVTTLLPKPVFDILTLSGSPYTVS